MSVYLLVAIIAKRLNLQRDLYTILQILSVPLFEKNRDLTSPRTCETRISRGLRS
jgi:hypothetical protein